MAAAIRLRQDRVPAVLITVVEAQGSTPRKAGARMIVEPGGALRGTIGGGKVEHALVAEAPGVWRSGEPRLVTYHLTADLGMCCGGRMTFFMEPLVSQPALIVFGTGHVGEAVVRIASRLGFAVTAVDDVPEQGNADRLPGAEGIVGSFEPADLASLPWGPETFVVIATREHALDQRLLELCLAHPLAYLGVIGSERKARTQRQRLEVRGFSEGDIARVRCPVGLDLGAETPEEIAVAICAELIRVRRTIAAS